ncbi:MAG: M20/M25/M40 family metallo-hydrolase, partial [Promethearchaeota archaeon]
IDALINALGIPEGAMIKKEIINAKPPYVLKDDDPFLQAVLKLANHQQAGIMDGYTEAGIFYNIAKIPTIILGPGSINQAHKANEHVSIKDLHKAEKLFTNIMLQHVKAANND